MTHTMTELMGMSEYNLNEVVLRLLGWTKHPHPAIPAWQKPTEYGQEGLYIIPFYSSDIRAAYELEESIPEELKEKYTNTMGAILGECRAVGENPTSPQFVFAMVHAPARIRCIAYILTLENAPKNEA